MSNIRATTISDETGNGPIALTKQHAAKAWGFNVLNSAVTSTNTFNISSFSDPGTGRTDLTLTNAMDGVDFPVVDGGTSNYPYQAKSLTASTLQVSSVNASGNYSDGGSNFAIFGDLA